MICVEDDSAEQGNGFHLLKCLHPPGYREILEEPTTLRLLLPHCCPACLSFGGKGSRRLGSPAGDSSGKALEPWTCPQARALLTSSADLSLVITG